MKQLLSLLALLAISPGALAIMKCSNGNQTWYQDVPCQPGMQSTQIQTAPVLTAPLAGSGQIISVPQEPSQPLAAPPKHIPISALEQEASLCLAWYKKEMQLPPDTQVLDFTKDQRVLTITVPVTIAVLNYLGGTNQTTIHKQASCEINGGRLDEGWTRIHAKRGGWIQ